MDDVAAGDLLAVDLRLEHQHGVGGVRRADLCHVAEVLKHLDDVGEDVHRDRLALVGRVHGWRAEDDIVGKQRLERLQVSGLDSLAQRLHGWISLSWWVRGWYACGTW